jgi:hypothetical protein
MKNRERWGRGSKDELFTIEAAKLKLGLGVVIVDDGWHVVTTMVDSGETKTFGLFVKQIEDKKIENNPEGRKVVDHEDGEEAPPINLYYFLDMASDRVKVAEQVALPDGYEVLINELQYPVLKEKTSQLQVTLPVRTVKLLKDEANKHGVSLSQYITYLLYSSLE